MRNTLLILLKPIRIGFLALLSLGLLSAIPAFAQSGAGHCDVCTRTLSDDWGVKTASQLTRGVLNTGLCWLELFRQPIREVQGSGNLLIGMGKGVGHSFLRMVQGAGEMVTCPLPHPKDGRQIAEDCSICMWQA